MTWDIYRFNYNPDTQKLDCPDNDPIPTSLHPIILAHRFLIEQESFELLRMYYEGKIFIIQKFKQAALTYKGVFYYYTFKLSR